MKRFLTCLAAVLALSAALCAGAAASDFDAVAEDLSAIGMFRGTADGFELDRAPTRSEAAIMLVRLYGAEEKAKEDYDAGTLRCPFTDVSKFSAPYVAWLYENGIANGTSATTFGSGQPCSAKMYCAFLLRALGYEDGMDFAYADTLTFAQSKGIYDSMLFSGDFLRDDLAALTYQALAADTKDGSTYLLASLIADGVVDAEAARPMTEKIEAYRTLASAQMDNRSMDVDVSMDMDMTMDMDGQTVTLPTVSEGRVQVILGEDSMEMASTVETTAQGQTTSTGTWMKDGWVYVSASGGGETMRYKYQMDEQLQDLMAMSGVNMDALNVSGLVMIDSIRTEKSGSDTLYTVEMGKGLGSAMDAVSGMVGQELGTIDFDKITAVYTMDAKGQMKAVSMTFSVAMTMDVPMDDGTVSAVSATMAYDMDMTVNATGDDVKITFPDFSDFQEMDLSEMNL